MYSFIVFLPLFGALIAGAIAIHGAMERVQHEPGNDRHDGDHHNDAWGSRGAELITCTFMAIAALLSWIAFFDFWKGGAEAFSEEIMPWIESGALSTSWSLRIDTLTVVMLVVVNTVSTLVHIYSIGYMHHDPHRPRFFAYLSLFTFAMLMLVTANNLLQMFFGWEGVGLASYLLIGFWFHKPSANAAAIKAFVVNRIGDFGFALGIFGIFVVFGSINFETIFANAQAVAGDEELAMSMFGHDYAGGESVLTIICLLLFLGAMGKSAQVPLHTWLPDAMEGPTPVSALIHAATMVTAGVFMVARLSPIFELSHTALMVVTFVGAFTALFAASVGLVQNDIKRVIAYSTCSQLGYMFVALGLGAYSVAIFHLFTHAFFKALLFLGAGSVIHAVADEQDMRRMGGLKSKIPVTYWMMLIGNIALTGVGIPGTIIGTSGFFSKDAIVEASFASHSGVAGFAFFCLVLAAVFTSFYSWRLFFMTFHGKPRAPADVMEHAHESPQIMLVPLYVLAAGALFAGLIFHTDFVDAHHFADFWRQSLFMAEGNEILEELHHVPFWVKASPFAAMLLGLILAYWFYIARPETPKALAAEHGGLYRFLLNKWYFDELFDFLFVRPAKALGTFFWKRGDIEVIDRFGPDGISGRVLQLTSWAVRLQTGYLYHYAFVMLIGVAALVTWMMFAG